MNTLTKTKSVTKTKLIIITLVALGAGGVAFATLPSLNTKYSGCVDFDAATSTPTAQGQLLTKSGTKYNSGTSTDYCYTAPATGKTYLMEGTCVKGKFQNWQKKCAELNGGKPGVNYQCVNGACVNLISTSTPPTPTSTPPSPTSTPPTSTVNLPDLRVGSAQLDDLTGKILVYIQNDGKAASTVSTDLKFYWLNGDTVVPYSDKACQDNNNVSYPQTRTIGPTSANAVFGGLLFSYPAVGCNAGSVNKIKIVLDSENKVNESNEQNEFVFPLPVTSKPDLFVTNVGFDKQNNTKSVRVYLQNYTNNFVPTTDPGYRIYWLDSKDVQPYSVLPTQGVIHDYDTNSVYIQFPEENPYFSVVRKVKVVMDPMNKIQEFNEKNNEMTVSIPTEFLPTEPTCKDSDGDNMYIKGHFAGINGATGSYEESDDQCISNTELRELYCGATDNRLHMKIINCDFGCNNGACISATSTPNTPTTTPTSTF